MGTLAKLGAVVAWAVILPSVAFAQASMTGTVRDTSGAVLPGVTVEAASPVLIEKVRAATTDGNGRYQIVDLRPGEYTVTFTLAGFNSVKREGVTLTGSSATNVDAELRRRFARRDDHGDRRGPDRGRVELLAAGGPERRHHRRTANRAQLRHAGPADSRGRLQRHRRRRIEPAAGRRERHESTGAAIRTSESR